MKNKILLTSISMVAIIGSVAAFSAFEAHVINVTAHIENALSANTYKIEFGTVFPQEKLEQSLNIYLSDSFLDQDRVDFVRYKITQKPKPIDPANAEWCHNWVTQHGLLAPIDPGFDLFSNQEYLTKCYPPLCYYLSKEPDNNPANDTGLPAFHKLTDIAYGILQTGVDPSDQWTIDLDVPCFEGQCAQEWGHPGWEPPAELNTATFGCDLWVEVTGIYYRDDLGGMWKFDEGQGNIAYDSSGNGNHGTLINNPTWIVPGTHLSFDGIDDYVDIPGIENNPNVITQEVWVKTTSPGGAWGWNVIMTKRHADDGSDWPTLTIYNGYAALLVDDKDYPVPIYNGTTLVNDGNWHYIVGVKDGCNYSIFVDGVRENYFTDCHPMDGSSYNLHIGHHGAWGNFFNGEIDNAAVYYKALTGKEIMEKYTGLECSPVPEVCGDGIDNDCDGQIDEGDVCEPWINEIHYDNTGTDIDEGVEIAGKADINLTGWTVVFYNGNGGASYRTLNLSGTISNQQGGYGTLWFGLPTDGIQNGAPDGLALVSPSNVVIQFLSYEGTFQATSGPASGMTSVDIGVLEPGTTPIGQSLQLQGTGNKYADFIWAGPVTHTRGAVNTDQTFN